MGKMGDLIDINDARLRLVQKGTAELIWGLEEGVEKDPVYMEKLGKLCRLAENLPEKLKGLPKGTKKDLMVLLTFYKIESYG